MLFVLHVFHGLGHGVGWSGRVGRGRGVKRRVGEWGGGPSHHGICIIHVPGADTKMTAGPPLTPANSNKKLNMHAHFELEPK